MNKDSFKEVLKEFLRVLEKEKDSFQTQTKNIIYDDCIYLTKIILSKVNYDIEKQFLENEFLNLSCLVSDSLPWNSTILVTWNNVHKKWVKWKQLNTCKTKNKLNIKFKTIYYLSDQNW